MRVPSHHCRLFLYLSDNLEKTHWHLYYQVQCIWVDFMLGTSVCSSWSSVDVPDSGSKWSKCAIQKKKWNNLYSKNKWDYFFTKVTISNGYRLGTDSDEELWYHICMYFSWQCMHYVGESETYFWSRSRWWRPTLSLLVSMEATIGILIQTLQ